MEALCVVAAGVPDAGQLGRGLHPLRNHYQSEAMAQGDGPSHDAEVALVGGGFRAYVTRRFVLRAEYKSYVVLTSRDENEEVEEWKVGFGFFF